VLSSCGRQKTFVFCWCIDVLLCNVRIVQTMMTLCMLMLCSASAALVMNGVHSAKTLCCMLQLASICSWGGGEIGVIQESQRWFIILMHTNSYVLNVQNDGCIFTILHMLRCMHNCSFLRCFTGSFSTVENWEKGRQWDGCCLSHNYGCYQRFSRFVLALFSDHDNSSSWKY